MKELSSKYYLSALALLLGLVIISASLFRSLYLHQQELISVHESRYNTYLLATQLRNSSNELTRLVRSYASTGNPLFEKQFWEVLAIRNGQSPLPFHYDRVYWDFMTINNGIPPYESGKPVSLKNLMKREGFTKDEFILLENSQENSDKLVALEKIAFNAMKGRYPDDKGEFTIIGKPNKQIALNILYGDEYYTAKIDIMAPINKFYKKLNQRTSKLADQTADKLDFTLSLQIFIFTIMICTIVLLMLIARRYHKNMVLTLNQRVDERTRELNSSNLQLTKALDEIKTLKGIIPICSYCHSIRDSEGKWNRLEAYLSDHSDARFSHGICHKCEPKARLEAGLDEK